MGSVVLDEVHCLWPCCSHSCCWESEQRIREGHPRILKTDPNKPFRRPYKEPRFPVFTLVDAADWIEEDLISWMAFSREATSQTHGDCVSNMSGNMETNQDKKTLKTGMEDLDWESLSVRVFPPEGWMSSRSYAETGSPPEIHSLTPSTSSSCSFKSQAMTASPKCQVIDPKFRWRGLKNTDIKLSRYIFQSPGRQGIKADVQSDTELYIRGITAPRNSKQSSVASSTLELNQRHLECWEKQL